MTGAGERARELADELAMTVLYHIDEMYPKMWEGVPHAARLSLRNTILNRAELLAGALAAVRLEGGWEEHMKHCLYCNQGAVGCDRGRALAGGERAVEAK